MLASFEVSMGMRLGWWQSPSQTPSKTPGNEASLGVTSFLYQTVSLNYDLCRKTSGFLHGQSSMTSMELECKYTHPEFPVST